MTSFTSQPRLGAPFSSACVVWDSNNSACASKGAALQPKLSPRPYQCTSCKSGHPFKKLSEALLVKVILWVGAIVRFVVDHLVKRSDQVLDGLEGKIKEIDFLMLFNVLLVLEQLRLQMEVMVLEVIGKIAEVFIAQIRIYPTLDLGMKPEMVSDE
jgi:hypothetical protein